MRLRRGQQILWAGRAAQGDCEAVAVILIIARVCSPVRAGARQDIVHIRRVADTFDGFSFFGKGGLLVQIVIVPVQVCYSLRYQFTFRVVLRSGADALASM